MPHILPKPSTFYYGDPSSTGRGIMFPVESHITAFSVTPTYDQSGRTVISDAYSITADAYITPRNIENFDESDTSDEPMAAIQRILSRQGGNFIMTGYGTGDINVNSPTVKSLRDLDWGPRPRVLSLRHIGNDQVWELSWTVSLTLPAQCRTAFFSGALMSFTSVPSYDIAPDGYSRRSYAIDIQIPQSRATIDTTTLADNADHYLELVLPKLPEGFRRESQNRRLDASKTKLSVTVTDSEMPPVAPPPGCVKVTANHTAQSTLRKEGWLTWTNTLRASYQLLKTTPKSRAWDLFTALAHDRLTWCGSFVHRKAGSGRGEVIPIALQADSGNLYGPDGGTYSFSWSYTIPKESVKKAMAIAGIQRIPPQADWKPWADSMLANGVMTPRGYALLEFQDDEDTLLDLCAPKGGGLAATMAAVATAAGRSGQRAGVLASEDSRLDAGQASPVNFLNFSQPTPEHSWLGYESAVILQQHDNVAVLRTLPTAPVQVVPQTGDVSTATDTGYQVPYRNTAPPIIQYRGDPTVYCVIVGRALRAGWGITPPTMTQVGGVQAIPMNDGQEVWRTKLVSNLCGIPVVAAWWALRYVLAGVPQTSVGAPDNFLLDGIRHQNKPLGQGGFGVTFGPGGRG